MAHGDKYGEIIRLLKMLDRKQAGDTFLSFTALFRPKAALFVFVKDPSNYALMVHCVYV